MLSVDAFLRGLILGFSIAAPVGPIGVLCIRRTLAHGRISGFISGLGAATADAFYGSVAAMGFTLISGFLVGQQELLRLFGGFFLCYLGLKTYLEKSNSLQDLNSLDSGERETTITGIHTNPRMDGITGKALFADYVSTFILTITNPMTIIVFAAIFTGLGITHTSGSPTTALVLVLGVFLGSTSWWLILSSLANSLRVRFLNRRRLRWVNRVSGVIIFGFGAVSILSLLDPSIWTA
jgi:threonine/homoserine/homoserine lactone efflux protein